MQARTKLLTKFVVMDSGGPLLKETLPDTSHVVSLAWIMSQYLMYHCMQ